MCLQDAPRARGLVRLLSLAAALALLVPTPWSDVRAQTIGSRPGYRGEARNAFELTAPILERLTAGEASAGFQRTEGETEIPKMTLRGMVMRPGGAKAALLEIAGAGTYVVREGDTIGLYQLGSSSVIRVKRVDRLQVEVEAGSLKQVIIVR
ncbi:hypothetical protein Thimo_0651 [Thioflavicoccus mobilis 8321]|uniref:Uncharacterized protein n=1 Tax=Thioflavicoccus mobilis 8321 TaxID=765912 RepID=L0GU52_9GAMM|nr:hypothetical protein [Thioflavicoccus mobilis]AGA89491.1 hypothetical protein Thimo_0651 [Thioflavicoccus mobilis 8321]